MPDVYPLEQEGPINDVAGQHRLQPLQPGGDGGQSHHGDEDGEPNFQKLGPVEIQEEIHGKQAVPRTCMRRERHTQTRHELRVLRVKTRPNSRKCQRLGHVFGRSQQ